MPCLGNSTSAVSSRRVGNAERLRTEPQPTVTRAPTIDGAPDVTKLGGTQLRILTALREAGAAGLTAGQVATQLGISPTNAPRALRKLEERGLATSSADRPALWRASADADREVSTAP